MQNCRNHPNVSALHSCEWCNEPFCNDCVEVKSIGSVQVVLCSCGGGCRPIANAQQPASQSFNPYGSPQHAGTMTATQKDLRQERAREAHELDYWSAFGYPISVGGVLLMVIGSLIYTVFSFAAMFSPIMGLIVLLLVGGYACAYFQKIIHSSSDGERDLPDWPDMTEIFSDIIRPGVQLLAGQLFCFAPAVFYGIYVSPDLIMILLALAGLIYLPIALLYVTLNDSLMSIVNVHVLVPSIGKIARDYFLVFAILVVLYALTSIIGLVLLMFSIPGIIVGNLLMFYVLIVQFRIIGIMYFKKQEVLDWF